MMGYVLTRFRPRKGIYFLTNIKLMKVAMILVMVSVPVTGIYFLTCEKESYGYDNICFRPRNGDIFFNLF